MINIKLKLSEHNILQKGPEEFVTKKNTFEIHPVTSLTPRCWERATTYISIQLQVQRITASSIWFKAQSCLMASGWDVNFLTYLNWCCVDIESYGHNVTFFLSCTLAEEEKNFKEIRFHINLMKNI